MKIKNNTEFLIAAREPSSLDLVERLSNSNLEEMYGNAYQLYYYNYFRVKVNSINDLIRKLINLISLYEPNDVENGLYFKVYAHDYEVFPFLYELENKSKSLYDTLDSNFTMNMKNLKISTELILDDNFSGMMGCPFDFYDQSMVFDKVKRAESFISHLECSWKNPQENMDYLDKHDINFSEYMVGKDEFLKRILETGLTSKAISKDVSKIAEVGLGGNHRM